MRTLLYYMVAPCILLGFLSCNHGKTTNGNETEPISILNSKDTVLQRNILGLKIGVTTKDSTIQIMKLLGSELTKVNQNMYVNSDGIYFGTVHWNGICIYFYDNKIRRINLAKSFENLDDFDNTFNKLSRILESKYRPLITEQEDSVQISFMDDSTFLDVGIANIGGQPSLTMDYFDIKLENEYNQKGIDEL